MSSWAGRGSTSGTALPRPVMYPQAGVFHNACEKRSQPVPCRVSVYNDPPVFPGRVDPSEQFRERRRRSRRRRRIRGLIVLACLVGGIVALALNARFISGDDSAAPPPAPPATAAAEPPPAPVSAVPAEIRGVHVTAALASIDGKLDEYIALKDSCLNTIELDVKDENGEVGFTRPDVPLARQVGAAQSYYNPRAVAQKAHAAELYLVGRVVVFQDPRLAAGRPDMAIQTPSGEVWTTTEGLGWTNPYDRRVWDYNVDVAEAAARAGFDEIMFDYVRFPTDGAVAAVYPDRSSAPKWQVIADFVEYATDRLRPLGVRVSAALFGLAATRDLGIGQRPRLLGKHLDAIYPMVYPSHFNSGEYDIASPNDEPGRTVSFALLDYQAKLADRKATVVPWLQDWGGYSLSDIEEQVSAADRAGSRGFMLWNAGAVYTDGALC